MAYCANSATLPALHLPNGDLLPSAAVSGWIAKQAKAEVKGKNKSNEHVNDDEEGYRVDSERDKEQEDNINIQIRTYLSLVEAKLKPALVCSISILPH